jgi:hypothetical protein
MLAAPTILHVPAQGASPCQNPASTNWHKSHNIQSYTTRTIIYNIITLLYYFVIPSGCYNPVAGLQPWKL